MPLWERLEAERARRELEARRPVGVEEFLAELLTVALEGLARARAQAERRGRLVVLPGERA